MMIASAAGAAQPAGKTAPDASSVAQNAFTLAESGHCTAALPPLKKSIAQVKDRELRRKVGLDGVRCAMTLHQNDAALEFLDLLAREFPKDPEALYVAVHAYSDLSTLSSQELAREAPSSYQAHELLAESFETQGKWDDAEKEYRAMLKQNPNLPGIHFRIGRILLSKRNPDPAAANEAKQEFVQELQIDPRNAGAEYVLGELARQNQEWDDAVNHFSRATKFDSQFGEAFLGLGMSLIAEKRYSEALTPLETAVKLEPKNPDAHYNLAMAYTRAGRKQDGEKEFAIHRSLIGNEGGAAEQPPSSSQPQEN
ncbi:MAG: tetratricopeptide repeat protein [Candidatus Sulfotelmatobacter sp.]